VGPFEDCLIQGRKVWKGLTLVAILGMWGRNFPLQKRKKGGQMERSRGENYSPRETIKVHRKERSAAQQVDSYMRKRQEEASEK